MNLSRFGEGKGVACSVSYPESGFSQVSGSGSGLGCEIRIHEGKNDPQKYNKVRNFMF
jgi:hypothetical protein